jgi:hypothetical protein
MAAATLIAAAVFCLLMAVVPRPRRPRPARALAFIRGSTLTALRRVRRPRRERTTCFAG